MQAARRIEVQPTVSRLLHEPVLLDQVVALLAPRSDGIYVDATLGAGGHAEALLAASAPLGRLIGIDRDAQALDGARQRLERHTGRFSALRGDHGRLREVLAAHGAFAVDGILFDLGLSSMQVDDAERGFSFRHDGPLDMRMDPASGTTAAELVARLGRSELERLLREFGEEHRAGAIARAIERERAVRPLTRTRQLAELVERVLGPRARAARIHPATRTFQALRIAVNGEVRDLRRTITEAVSLLRRGGRIVVISYHSLEDREVKLAFRELAHRCTCPPTLPLCVCGKENVLRVLTSRPVRPERDEVERNPRSRSAKLRAAERQ